MIKQRPAVAMIELIFAIVVMGIVMMSAPQLLSTANQSSYTAIQQEGINEVASQMTIIMDYPWDENDTNVSHPTILNVTNGNNALDGMAGYHKRMPGTPVTSHRLFISYDGDEFDASVIGSDPIAGVLEPEIDDIDDFNNTTINLTQITASTKDYIEKGIDINIIRTVTYISDVAANYNTGGGGTLTFAPFTALAGGGSSNIKHIQATLTSTSGVDELAKTITLHAFSCNIGTYELEER